MHACTGVLLASQGLNQESLPLLTFHCSLKLQALQVQQGCLTTTITEQLVRRQRSTEGGLTGNGGGEGGGRKGGGRDGGWEECVMRTGGSTLQKAMHLV